MLSRVNLEIFSAVFLLQLLENQRKFSFILLRRALNLESSGDTNVAPMEIKEPQRATWLAKF